MPDDLTVLGHCLSAVRDVVGLFTPPPHDHVHVGVGGDGIDVASATDFGNFW